MFATLIASFRDSCIEVSKRRKPRGEEVMCEREKESKKRGEDIWGTKRRSENNDVFL
jgi:hypothetical protein